MGLNQYSRVLPPRTVQVIVKAPILLGVPGSRLTVAGWQSSRGFRVYQSGASEDEIPDCGP